MVALFFFMAVLASCEEDKVIYDSDQGLVAFTTTAATLPVTDAGVSSIKIGVAISTVSAVSRAIPITVDSKSTALAPQYSIDAATLVIPAGSYLGEVLVSGNFDNLNANETVKLILNLGVLDKTVVESKKKTFELSIYKACTSALGGTFNFSTTNMTSPDSGGRSVAGPVVGTVTFTASATPGLYTISDASFGGFRGLYFADYGITSATGLSLIDVCNKIAFSGKDQYGESYTFSNVVVSGTKLTFNWASGYGEKGLTTLTRTDGKNWPNLKS